MLVKRWDSKKHRCGAQKFHPAKKAEQEKLSEERSKTRWAAISVFVPLTALVITIYFGVRSGREKARADFAIKEAELVINTKNPGEAHAKAEALEDLFSDRLKDEFGRDFRPGNYGIEGDPATESKLELLKLTIGNPKQKQDSGKLTDSSYYLSKWELRFGASQMQW